MEKFKEELKMANEAVQNTLFNLESTYDYNNNLYMGCYNVSDGKIILNICAPLLKDGERAGEVIVNQIVVTYSIEIEDVNDDEFVDSVYNYTFTIQDIKAEMPSETIKESIEDRIEFDVITNTEIFVEFDLVYMIFEYVDKYNLMTI